MGHLPAYPSPFIGRLDELAHIDKLLSDPACRLLTLVGPGGVGKTRLAVEAARQPAFPDGTHLVLLQPLTSPDYIISAIADAVGFQFYPGAEPNQQLLDYFREKSFLLILDNLEHLLEGVILLSEILAAAPAVRILATSRERLNLREEWVLEVGGLPYPASEADAERYSAVELFVQHARRAKVGFTLTDANRPAIAHICQLVGGMPLGIELAASWVWALSCAAIAEEIERSLDILETSARNVEPRHRSMRAALDQSWHLLSDAERAVFRKLSVFRGGFRREAAEAVAGASLRRLTTLIDKSLVRVDGNGRYDVHELLRQYGEERLDESADETSTTAEHHLAYFLKLTEAPGRDRESTWYDYLEPELDNFRAALAWALHHEQAEKGLRLAASLSWFFGERSRAGEGLTWLEQMLAVADDAPPTLRAKALARGGESAALLADYPRALALAQQALVLARATHDRSTTALALATLGFYDDYLQRPEQSAQMLEESLALLRQLADPTALADVLRRRARVAIGQEEYEYARALLEEALQADQTANNTGGAAWTLQYLADLLRRLNHDPNESATYYERSVSLFREARYPFGAAISLNMLGWWAFESGNHGQAQARFSEALVLIRDSSPNHGTVGYSSWGIAGIARAHGKLERAAQLMGVAEIDVKSGGKRAEIEEFDKDVGAIQEQLNPAIFAAAWAAGKTMTREYAIAYALETAALPTETPIAEAANDAPAPDPLQPASQRPIEPLSQREMEILRLIAEGLSNGEIAARLVLATSTVKWYVNQIFSKLHVTTRTQAVASARALGRLD